MAATVHFYVLTGGGSITIALLGRMVFQLGGMIASLKKHVEDSEKIHADFETRMRRQELRRR
jgi:hypothetical protein